MNCVITGAAAGIGKALAKRFATAGNSVVGIDVDVDAAAQTIGEINNLGGDISFLTEDLASDAGLKVIAAELVAGPPIDVLVHNAGINHVARFAESDMALQRQVIQLNLTAPMLLTAELLRADKFAPSACLVFIASLSHFVSYPGAAVYAGSKDGLTSYAKSLSVALAPQRINVLTVFPGPTRTEHARRHSPDNRREHRRMPPDKLAALIHRSVLRKRRFLVPGYGNKIIRTLAHFFPRFVERQMRWAILDKL